MLVTPVVCVLSKLYLIQWTPVSEDVYFIQIWSVVSRSAAKMWPQSPRSPLFMTSDSGLPLAWKRFISTQFLMCSCFEGMQKGEPRCCISVGQRTLGKVPVLF